MAKACVAPGGILLFPGLPAYVTPATTRIYGRELTPAWCVRWYAATAFLSSLETSSEMRALIREIVGDDWETEEKLSLVTRGP